MSSSAALWVLPTASHQSTPTKRLHQNLLHQKKFFYIERNNYTTSITLMQLSVAILHGSFNNKKKNSWKKKIQDLSAIARSQVDELAFAWLLGTAGGITRIIFRMVRSLLASCHTEAEQQLVDENAGAAIADPTLIWQLSTGEKFGPEKM